MLLINTNYWSKRIHQVRNYKHTTEMTTRKQGSSRGTPTCVAYERALALLEETATQHDISAAGAGHPRKQMHTNLIRGRCPKNFQAPLLVKPSALPGQNISTDSLLRVNLTCSNKLASSFQSDLWGRVQSYSLWFCFWAVTHSPPPPTAIH